MDGMDSVMLGTLTPITWRGISTLGHQHDNFSKYLSKFLSIFLGYLEVTKGKPNCAWTQHDVGHGERFGVVV